MQPLHRLPIRQQAVGRPADTEAIISLPPDNSQQQNCTNNNLSAARQAGVDVGGNFLE